MNDQIINVDEQIPDGADSTTQGRLGRMLEHLESLGPR